MEEIIWGRKDLIGPEASKGRRKTFGGGKHLGEENIWGGKHLIGGKHLGDERFNWMKTFGGGKI